MAPRALAALEAALKTSSGRLRKGAWLLWGLAAKGTPKPQKSRARECLST